jgi:hypothetical protein
MASPSPTSGPSRVGPACASRPNRPGVCRWSSTTQQRCLAAGDIRLSNGALLVETDDPQAYTSVTALGPAINDGLPHDVVVERLAGNLVVLVDSVQVGSKASAANFGGLPPLVVGADACDADGSTIALVGSLTNLCVAAQ